MTQGIAGFFSDKYINHKAVGSNQLLKLMYRGAYPFALLLNKFRFTPNQITSLSIVLAVLAAISLIIDKGNMWFIFFWGGSLLLDFCDGTVARMTGNVSKTALRYDHVSDLFKIFIVMLAAGFHYDAILVWLSAMIASFSFMYFMLLNQELDRASSNIGNKNEEARLIDRHQEGAKTGGFKFVKTLINNDFLEGCLKNFYIAFVTINGHTLLVFLFMPLGSEATIIIFCYLIFVSVLGIVTRILGLLNIPR